MKSLKKLQNLSSPLCNIISEISNNTDAFSFLRDLLTEAELVEFSQRLMIAHMLDQGISYKKIEEDTGASSTTIARVSKFLQGEFGGYKKFLKYIG